MDWVLRSPQIYSTFGSLGYAHANGYHVNENCNDALESILQSILSEDKYLRSYRRSISFGQNVKKDLIPLLLHCDADKTRNLIIKILMNLTIPVECLLVVDAAHRSEQENQIIFEIHNLLTTTKSAFADKAVTKEVVDYLKKNLLEDLKKNLGEDDVKLSTQQCTNISNTLSLFRNILHIPDNNGCIAGRGDLNFKSGSHSPQNQILWNAFGQNLDKVLIKLMTIPEATHWSVTMVQLIALLYKDQQASTLHKLLNVWLETSVSDTSDDNESNTSNPDRGSANSSPDLTSDPGSDTSDSGSRKPTDVGEGSNYDSNGSDVTMNYVADAFNTPFQADRETTDQAKLESNSSGSSDSANENITDNSTVLSEGNGGDQSQNKKVTKITMLSDSSDCGYGTQKETRDCMSTSSEDDDLLSQKRIYPKPFKFKSKPNNNVRMLATPHDKRKKLVKRGKSIVTMNFRGLLITTPTDEDISHMMKEFTVDFLLGGYDCLVKTLHHQILTNMELEIETAHFFWLATYFLKFATQIEMNLDIISSVLSFEILSYFTAEGANLCEQFELATMLDESNRKLILRRLHLVVTGIREFVQAIEAYEKLTITCDKSKDLLLKLTLKMSQAHELHCLFILLLRYFNVKYYTKQYLQDLIVTNHVLLTFVDRTTKKPGDSCSVYMMEHLRQFTAPEIMQQYGLLLEDYQSNDEFVNDCIFTVMHHVGNELGSLMSLFQPPILTTFVSIWRSNFEVCDDWSDLVETVINTFVTKPQAVHRLSPFSLYISSKPIFAEAEPKPGGQAQTQAGEGNADDEATDIDMGRCNKTENQSTWRSVKNKKISINEIRKICEQFKLDEQPKASNWLQKVLLETCIAKKFFKENVSHIKTHSRIFEDNDLPVMSSVAWLALLNDHSVPLIPWNCEQAAISKDIKFLQLVHNLGFHMPSHMTKVYIRIPKIWTAEYLYEVATMLGPVDTATTEKIKFSLSDTSGSTQSAKPLQTSSAASDNSHQNKKAKHPVMVNCTPSPVFSDTDDIATNWLDIVKKSQQRKLIFEMGYANKTTATNTVDNWKCDVTAGSETCQTTAEDTDSSHTTQSYSTSS